MALKEAFYEGICVSISYQDGYVQIATAPSAVLKIESPAGMGLYTPGILIIMV